MKNYLNLNAPLNFIISVTPTELKTILPYICSLLVYLKIFIFNKLMSYFFQKKELRYC